MEPVNQEAEVQPNDEKQQIPILVALLAPPTQDK
jgi:hypothetical protein